MGELFLRNKRLTAWTLITALAAFSIFCIFWTPYDQFKLLRPIPANAVMISSHYHLGSRLEGLSTNIFLKAFFDSGNSAKSELFRGNRRRITRIASSQTIMAYVPDFNQFTTRGAWSSNPAFVISSWVGAWSPVLRWALWLRPPADIMRLGEYNGHRLWTFKKPVSFSGTVSYFSFAIDEGVFIGCLSAERNDIAHLMRIYDGRAGSILPVRHSPPQADDGGSVPACKPPVADITAGRRQGWFREKAPVADQIWLRFNLPYSAQRQSVYAIASLDKLKNDYLAATIRFEPDIFHAFSVIDQQDYLPQNRVLAEAGKIFACSPSIVALFSSDLAGNALDGLLPPAWASTVKPILSPSSGTNNVCLLMVFSGAYGGQFGSEPFRIAVPTVLLAVSGPRQEQTEAAVFKLLDLINARHQLGLILNSALPPAGQCPIFVIEHTSGALLKSMPVEDQPGFAFYRNWFLLASNSTGLRKLLLNFQTQAVPANKVNNNLLNQPDSLQKKAFIWIDPDTGGKALRFALTAAIMLTGQEGERSSNRDTQDVLKTIAILKTARAWLEDISHLKNCAVWMESENGKTVARLEIGRKN